MPRHAWTAVVAAAVAAQVSGEEVPKHWGQPRFRGKRVLVTGGDSGIGFAAVQTFYLECAKVLLVGHSAAKSRAAFQEISGLPVPQECAGSPPGVAWAAVDVSNATEVAGMLGQIVQEFGGLDIAVNNAGTAGSATHQVGEPGFLDASGRLYDESIWNTNVAGTLKCMDAEISHWIATETNGVIVNIASIAGETAWGGPLYTSSKWAMVGFTKQAALHHAPRGIRINAVAPGAVNTTMLRNGLSPSDPRWIARRRSWESTIPIGRIAEPWEIAGPISFLASDMASYSTGMILTVDGGVTLARPGPVDPAPPSLRPPPTLGGVAGARVPAPAPSVQPETPDGARQWGQPRFRAKRVLVTGGDSGIGLAAVQAFYLECAQVLMVGHSESKTRAAHAEVSALGTPAACAGSAPSVAWAAADISNESQVTSVMKRMLQEFGGLDIAVNNAGIGQGSGQIGTPGFVEPSGSLKDQSILDVNMAGTLKCMDAEISHFLEAAVSGVVVNVASVCGEVAYCSPPFLYGVSKAAVISATRQAALSYAPHGIRVAALDPGAVNTTLLRGGRSPTDPVWLATRRSLEAMIPQSRISEPWEMAGPITFLASDMASYVTGATATVDGGFVLNGPVARPAEEAEAAPRPVLV